MAQPTNWVDNTGQEVNAAYLNALGADVNSKLVSGGALGTPASGTLANCGSLPFSGLAATGTPSATTFYRGDGAWVTPTGTSGVSAAVFGAVAAAPSGVAATDTAAIQAAHTALPSGGGMIWLQPGNYLISAGGVTFTKPTRLVGTGGLGGTMASSLVSAANNATILTLSGSGFAIERVGFAIAGGTVPVSGYGVSCNDTHNLRIDDCWFYNLYDCVRLPSTGVGVYWSMSRCMVQSPVRYGVFVSNTTYPDNGDGIIHSCWFDPQGAATRNPTAAIRWESAGGFRVTNCKINGGNGGRFVTGIDVENLAANTADIFVQNNSLENIYGDGVWIRGSTNHTLWGVIVAGNEFMGMHIGGSGSAVRIGAAITGCIVYGNVGLASGGTNFTAASPTPTVAANLWEAD